MEACRPGLPSRRRLAPVVLYKLSERYFVLYGNHRVSEARYQGVQWIEAEVTQLYVGTPAVPSSPVGTGQQASGTEKITQPAVA